MAEELLSGVGVLVTRPRAQAAPLVDAIEAAGGKAHLYPALEIVSREPDAIAEDRAQLPDPDITIFVSRNAARFGAAVVSGERVVAIGPATAAELAENGQPPSLVPDGGFDSESLLAMPDLKSCEGMNILIVRGGEGRGLLGETLSARGASVAYLPVYERAQPRPSEAELEALSDAWNDIGVVMLLSVETLDNLLRLLPSDCRETLSDRLLVTPSARVLKEVSDRIPASQPVLASGPEAVNMVDAVVASLRTGNET